MFYNKKTQYTHTKSVARLVESIVRIGLKKNTHTQNVFLDYSIVRIGLKKILNEKQQQQAHTKMFLD